MLDYDTGHRAYASAQQGYCDNRAQAAAYERSIADHRAALNAQNESLGDMRKTELDLEKRREEVKAVLRAFPGLDDCFSDAQKAADTGERDYSGAVCMKGVAAAPLGSVFASPGVDRDAVVSGARQNVKSELARIENGIATVQAAIRSAQQAISRLQGAIRGLNSAMESCQANMRRCAATMDAYSIYSSYGRYAAAVGG